MAIRVMALLVLCTLAAPATGAAFSEPVANHENVPVRTLGGAPSIEQVREAIIIAAKKRNWGLAEGGPGQLVATLRVRAKHTAEVTISYDAERYSVVYRNSDNLNYDAQTIHPNYNRWVRDLVDQINISLSTIAVGHPPARAVAIAPAAPHSQPTPPRAAIEPALGLRAESNDVAVTIRPVGERQPRGWGNLVAEWQVHMPAAVDAIGAKLVAMQVGEPRPMGQPGTMIAIRVDSFRFVSPARRFSSGIIAGTSSLSLTVEFLDLQTGKPLAEPRTYNAYSEASQGVFAETTNRQVRDLAAQILQDLRLLPSARPAAVVATPAPAPTTSAATRAAGSDSSEIAFWESVRNSNNPVELQAYLQEYPKGVFAPIAKARLATMGHPVAPDAAPPPPAQR